MTGRFSYFKTHREQVIERLLKPESKDKPYIIFRYNRMLKGVRTKSKTPSGVRYRRFIRVIVVAKTGAGIAADNIREYLKCRY